MPLKEAAGNLVRRAVKKGILPKLDGTIKCVDCGGIAKHYDHRDYSRPLDVNPVCPKCNSNRGPGKANPFKLHSVYIDYEVWEYLNKIAYRKTITLPELTRQILTEYVFEYNK